MQTIGIEQEIRTKVPKLRLLSLECDVKVEESSSGLSRILDETCQKLRSTLSLETIRQIPAIRDSRIAYRAAGKDPARYRLSAEALMRRVVKGEELYRISNVVDLLNLVSLNTGFSIGGYDSSKITGTVRFGIGGTNELYTGIGRGLLNIEGLPVFRDDDGAFGSPTSDSLRTCVDSGTQRFLMIIIDFGGSSELDAAGAMAASFLRQFAGGDNLEIVLTQ